MLDAFGRVVVLNARTTTLAMFLRPGLMAAARTAVHTMAVRTTAALSIAALSMVVPSMAAPNMAVLNMVVVRSVLLVCPFTWSNYRGRATFLSFVDLGFVFLFF